MNYQEWLEFENTYIFIIIIVIIICLMSQQPSVCIKDQSRLLGLYQGQVENKFPFPSEKYSHFNFSKVNSCSSPGIGKKSQNYIYI